MQYRKGTRIKQGNEKTYFRAEHAMIRKGEVNNCSFFKQSTMLIYTGDNKLIFRLRKRGERVVKVRVRGRWMIQIHEENSESQKMTHLSQFGGHTLLKARPLLLEFLKLFHRSLIFRIAAHKLHK